MPTTTSSVVKDIGSYIYPVHGDINVTGTAGGAGDDTEADGDWHAVPDGAQSACVLITWTCSLTASETFSLTANLQDATALAGTGAADFLSAKSLSTTAVATATGANAGCTKIRYPDIRAHRGYIRTQVTGDLSAGVTDTFEYAVTVVYGGTTIIPAEV